MFRFNRWHWFVSIASLLFVILIFGYVGVKSRMRGDKAPDKKPPAVVERGEKTSVLQGQAVRLLDRVKRADDEREALQKEIREDRLQKALTVKMKIRMDDPALKEWQALKDKPAPWDPAELKAKREEFAKYDKMSSAEKEFADLIGWLADKLGLTRSPEGVKDEHAQVGPDSAEGVVTRLKALKEELVATPVTPQTPTLDDYEKALADPRTMQVKGLMSGVLKPFSGKDYSVEDIKVFVEDSMTFYYVFDRDRAKKPKADDATHVQWKALKLAYKANQDLKLGLWRTGTPQIAIRELRVEMGVDPADPGKTLMGVKGFFTEAELPTVRAAHKVLMDAAP